LRDVNYHIAADAIGELIAAKEAKKGVLQMLNAFKKALKDELSEDVEEFRYGGALTDGDEITFIALDGEPRKGTIVSRIDKDFEVSTSKGVSLVGRDDILSKSEPKQRSKFLGFFEKGGEVGENENDKNKYFSIHNIQALEDKDAQSIVLANVDNTPEKRKLAREYYPEDSYYFQYHNQKIDMRVMYAEGGSVDINVVDMYRKSLLETSLKIEGLESRLQNPNAQLSDSMISGSDRAKLLEIEKLKQSIKKDKEFFDNQLNEIRKSSQNNEISVD